MEWPLVTLLLGLLVPITITLIKLLPSRNPSGNSCEKSQLRTELAVLTTRYDSFAREVDQLRKDMEMLRTTLETVRHTMMEINTRDS